MSFIKNLFEKLIGYQDIKYGKGHKLGDSNTPSTSHHQEQPVHQPQTYVSQSEASRLAGEAALARMTNSKKYFG